MLEVLLVWFVLWIVAYYSVSRWMWDYSNLGCQVELVRDCVDVDVVLTPRTLHKWLMLSFEHTYAIAEVLLSALRKRGEWAQRRGRLLLRLLSFPTRCQNLASVGLVCRAHIDFLGMSQDVSFLPSIGTISRLMELRGNESKCVLSVRYNRLRLVVATTSPSRDWLQ